MLIIIIIIIIIMMKIIIIIIITIIAGYNLLPCLICLTKKYVRFILPMINLIYTKNNQ